MNREAPRTAHGPEQRHRIETPEFVSVVVPVWNDALRLKTCLGALANQDYPADRYEVIVVDNGSSDDPASVVAGFPEMQLLREPRPASDAARNAGLEAARGPILAFTDSDCIPCPDWIRCGVDALGRLARPGLIAGRIDVTVPDVTHASLAELHDLAIAFLQQRCVRRSHYGATANVFTRREVFDAVGPFRSDLLYGGDAEWGGRVYRSGRPVVYADGARVSHPARKTVGALIQRTRRGAGALVQWRRDRPILVVRDLLKDLVPPPDTVWRIITTSVLAGPITRLRVLLLFLMLRQVRFWERVRVIGGAAALR